MTAIADKPKLVIPGDFDKLRIVRAFCPTGEGGGVDPSCSPGERSAAGSVPQGVPWTKKGGSLGTLYHGGKEKVREIDPEKLQTRDPGFLGPGFYMAQTPTGAKFYGRVVTQAELDPEATVLDVGGLRPELAPDGLVDELKREYKERIRARGRDPDDPKYQIELDAIGSSNISFQQEARAYGDRHGYDVINFGSGEVVITNPKVFRFKKQKDAECTWVTIRGNPVCIRGGESQGAKPEEPRETLAEAERALADVRPPTQDTARFWAKTFDYPEEMIQIKDYDRDFEVGGSVYSEAGHANLETGEIVMRKAALERVTAAMADSMMAHEVQHQKYQVVREALRAEQVELMAQARSIDEKAKDPAWVKDNPDWRLMIHERADGLLRRGDDGKILPELREQYPIKALLDELEMDIDWMEKDDGFTDYSTSWWKEWKSGRPQPQGIWTPVHETLAEMAKVEQMLGVPIDRAAKDLRPSGKWIKYYKAVNKAYLRSAGRRRFKPPETKPGMPTKKAAPAETILYFDDEFRPAPPEKATWAKRVTSTGFEFLFSERDPGAKVGPAGVEESKRFVYEKREEGDCVWVTIRGRPVCITGVTQEPRAEESPVTVARDGKAEREMRTAWQAWRKAGGRDKPAETYPAESVPFDRMVATQNNVEESGVREFQREFEAEGKYDDDPFLVEFGGRYFIQDGHHRIEGAKRAGAKSLRVRVFHLSEPKVEKANDCTWVTIRGNPVCIGGEQREPAGEGDATVSTREDVVPTGKDLVGRESNPDFYKKPMREIRGWAKGVLERFGVSPRDVRSISIKSGRGEEFEVEGKKYKRGGSYNPGTKNVTLYTNEHSDRALGGMLVHEAFHAKFGSSRGGRIRLVNALWRDKDRFANEQGVSEYSKQYWARYREKSKFRVSDPGLFTESYFKDQFELAVNETLAETARLYSRGRADQVPQYWRGVYERFTGEYHRRRGGRAA